MIGVSQTFRDAICGEHSTRVRASYDVNRDEFTVVQDGKAGIRVVTMSLDTVLAAVPADRLA